MKIIISALHINGIASEGGSSLYFKCIIDELLSLGHDVYASSNPNDVMNTNADIIICSHNRILNQIKHHKAYKICISQGIIGDEILVSGADKYYSISYESQQNNLKHGINSEILNQPIQLQSLYKSNDKLQNILIIRRERQKIDPFNFLRKQFNVIDSDISIPIEEQIKSADLCITLGRGALSSMSMGKQILVADNRPYIGSVGDGYVDHTNILSIAKHNFSGRATRIELNDRWILSELQKYDTSNQSFLYDYICTNHDSKIIVNKLIEG